MWDGGPTLTQDEAVITLDRMRSAIQHNRDHYRVVVDDDSYEVAQRDLNNLNFSQ